MLKARAGKAILIGLSDENMKRLAEGKPILFDGGEIGFPGFKFAIYNGRTEQSMEQDLIDGGLVIPQ